MSTSQPKGQKRQTLMIVAGVLAAIITLLVPAYSKAQISITSRSVNVNNNGKTTVKFNNWQKQYKIEFEGDFELSDDDTDIVGVSRGGYFEISRSAFGSRRRVVVEADSRGNLIKDYYVGRERLDFEPEGREWLAEILPEIVRSTIIGAESRVNRFYRKDGVNGVLGEVRELESDYLKSHYLDLLLEKDGLNDDELTLVIDEAADELGSDYYISELLKNNEKQFLSNAKTFRAYVRASEEISSDHYRSEVLKKALRNDDIDGEVLEAILESAEDVSSDHYLTEILKETLDTRDLSDDLIQMVIQSARSISSDHYQSQLFREALDHDQISDKSYWEIVDAAGDISSDHYKTELFEELLEEEMTDEVMLKMLENIEDDISSDHYSHILLSKIIVEHTLSPESMEAYGRAVANVNSDHYASQIIQRAADHADMDDELVLALLDTCEEIGSDYYLSEALQALAPYINERNDSKLRDAYRSVAREISSDTYYGRAMKALD